MIMSKNVNPEIIAYVESTIIPQYSNFDKAHHQNHARMVIDQSLHLAKNVPDINMDMVYVIAAFHDLGLVNGRERHHIDSRIILQKDEFLKKLFSAEQIDTMGDAVEDHRASKGSEPRSIYGRIVAEADRFIDVETILRRTIQYGLANYPELDHEGHYRRTIEHLEKKYGEGGYLKVCIPWSDNSRRLAELRRIIKEPQQLRVLFDKLYNEECNDHSAGY